MELNTVVRGDSFARWYVSSSCSSLDATVTLIAAAAAAIGSELNDGTLP